MPPLAPHSPNEVPVPVEEKDTAIGFVCSELPDGWTWTLTSRLGRLLATAEERYGPRDKSYTPLGVEFGGDGPGLWYPGNRGNVSIRLGRSAADDPSQAFFQLAHEVIHLLAPSGGMHAPVFEEGLATAFADEQASAHRSSWRSAAPDYLAAKALVVRLLTKNPDAVRDIRTNEPSFSNWSPDLIEKAAPGLYSGEELRALCRPFAAFSARF